MKNLKYVKLLSVALLLGHVTGYAMQGVDKRKLKAAHLASTAQTAQQALGVTTPARVSARSRIQKPIPAWMAEDMALFGDNEPKIPQIKPAKAPVKKVEKELKAQALAPKEKKDNTLTAPTTEDKTASAAKVAPVKNIKKGTTPDAQASKEPRASYQEPILRNPFFAKKQNPQNNAAAAAAKPSIAPKKIVDRPASAPFSPDQLVENDREKRQQAIADVLARLHAKNRESKVAIVLGDRPASAPDNENSQTNSDKKAVKLQPVGQDQECGICLETTKALAPDKTIVTQCCKNFLCTDCASQMERQAQVKFQELEDPVRRKELSEDPNFQGWPEQNKEHAECPYCRHYPLERIFLEQPEEQAAAMEQAEQDEEDITGKKECFTCLEEKDEQEFTALSCCGYNDMCNACYEEGMVNVAIEGKNTDALKCPNRECAKPIEQIDLAKIVYDNSEKLEKLAEIETNKALAINPHIKNCPTPDCPYAFEYNGTYDHPRTVCPECQAHYCAHCLINHRDTISCKEAKENQENAELAGNTQAAAQAMAKWKQEHSKPCPGCKVDIEKNDGCNHMTCNKCRHEFCWRCLGNWRNHAQCPYDINPGLQAAQANGAPQLTQQELELAEQRRVLGLDENLMLLAHNFVYTNRMFDRLMAQEDYRLNNRLDERLARLTAVQQAEFEQEVTRKAAEIERLRGGCPVWDSEWARLEHLELKRIMRRMPIERPRPIIMPTAPVTAPAVAYQPPVLQRPAFLAALPRPALGLAVNRPGSAPARPAVVPVVNQPQAQIATFARPKARSFITVNFNRQATDEFIAQVVQFIHHAEFAQYRIQVAARDQEITCTTSATREQFQAILDQINRTQMRPGVVPVHIQQPAVAARPASVVQAAAAQINNRRHGVGARVQQTQA